MSNDFWLGVAVPGVVVLGIAAFALALRALVRLGAAIGGQSLRFGADLPRHKREVLAATLFAARRGFIATSGEVAVVVMVGMDHEQLAEARNALRRPIKKFDSTAHFKAIKHPHPKGDQ